MTGDQLALFLNLYLGHLLGDFLFQPGKLVLAKRRGAPGLLTHTAIVGACCALALAGELGTHWLAIALIVPAHGAIELVTIYTYRVTPTRGLFTFLLDQSLHVASILLVVWVTGAWGASESVNTFGLDLASGDVALVAGLIAVGLLGSILVFETANTILVPRGGKGILLRFDSARAIGIIERVASLAACLWISPLVLPVPFLPRLVMSGRLPKADRDRRLVTLGAGAVLVSLVYILLVAQEAALQVPILP